MKKIKILLMGLLASSTLCASTNESKPQIEQLYDYLNQVSKVDYVNTYSKPSPLIDNLNWIVSMPNLWGKNLTQYENSLIPMNGYSLSSTLNLPLCGNDNDCNSESKCLEIFNKEKVCTSFQKKIIDTIYNLIISAEHSVDIITLQPFDTYSQTSFSNDAFTETLKQSFNTLSKKATKDNPITVRMLQGQYNIVTSPNPMQEEQSDTVEPQSLSIFEHWQYSYLKKLTADINNPYFNVYVVSQSAGLTSWNHGKIINIDNKKVLTGGINMFGTDYLESNPVNDLSNIVNNQDVAEGASEYMSLLLNPGVNTLYCDAYHGNKLVENLCAPIESSYKHGKSTDIYSDNLVMFIGKYTNQLDTKDKNKINPSQVARIHTFYNAKKSIKISQQAIVGMLGSLPESMELNGLDPLSNNISTIDALAYAISNNVQIDIVTANHLGMNPAAGYTSFVSADDFRKILLNKLLGRGISKQDAELLIKNHLRYKYIAYDKGNNHVGDLYIGNHQKFWMVDDNLYYIGSDNMYPADHQEFGVIRACKSGSMCSSVSQIIKGVWNPMWENSLLA